MVVVMHGNPFDGMDATGPFKDEDAAVVWADQQTNLDSWWVVPLEYAPDQAGFDWTLTCQMCGKVCDTPFCVLCDAAGPKDETAGVQSIAKKGGQDGDDIG